ncbi:beta-lactamase [Microdochium trichocladiopsis]|uniref:Beta-lactamase n=1 Tax=Microdochium trichocladiopsis TaxID=1682393 RepID=A0A9P9BNT6_9PEZI|nr:beta-lactamase [Microdochium trichocladiopsis]KAH7028073.1 beta-lactamase [Microdochium trichocladiopsis]
MVQSKLPAFVFAVLAGSEVALGARDYLCPPLGPVLPAPKSLASQDPIKLATAGLTEAFENATSKFQYAGVSIQVRSLHEKEPLIDLHYTPPNADPKSTTKIDADSVYRIGSLSKVFNILSVLRLGKVRWDDYVVDYLPELLQLEGEADEEVDDVTTVRWRDVTIGSLASHMSGIATDLVNDLSSFPGIPFTSAGLPEINQAELQNCAGVMGLPPCTRDQFFRDFGKRHPVYAPFTTPVYSNIASVILGFVVEAVSGKPYADYLQESIFAPVGLKSTTVHEAPSEPVGWVPVNETWWGGSLGYEDAAGGLYSSTNDIQALGHAILSSSLLTPVQTRAWMKPHTSTSSSGLLMGGPWEILRSTTVTKDQRLVEFYCKAGNLKSYNNMLCLVPDYDLVLTILSGGKESGAVMVDSLLNAVVTAVVPAAEAVGKAEAGINFAGTYSDAESNSTLTISTDDGPGFEVSGWQVRDVPTLQAMAFLKSAGAASAPVQPDIRVRLYPTNFAKKTYKQSWRAVFDMGKPEQLQAIDESRFWPMASCHTWGSMDRFVYQFRGIDDFVFEIDEESGKAVSLELRGFKVVLKREE